MKIESNFTVIDGIRTHWMCAGVGEGGQPPVILLHGGGIDSANLSWGAFIPELANHRQVIAPDLPGYGQSDVPDVTYTTDFYLRFVVAFMDALGIQRAGFAGISMGGGISLGMAIEHPERVERLVLVDSYGLQAQAPGGKWSYLFLKIPGLNALTWAAMRNKTILRWTLVYLLKRPGSLTDEIVDLAYAQMLKPRSSVAFQSYQNADLGWSGTRTFYTPHLSQINVPTLIVHGSLDTSVPVENARLAHARIRGSQLHWMEGCGHWPQRDNPQEFNRVVTAFFAGEQKN